MPPRTPKQPRPAGLFWQPALLGALKIFLFSAVLGLIYNFSNPIGVRPSPPQAVLSDSSPASAPVAVGPAEAPSPRAEAPVDFEEFSESNEAAEPGTPQAVSWASVREQVNAGRIVLVDVRPRSSFEAGHIPGAISVPYRRPAQSFGPFQSTESTAFLGREFAAFRELHPLDTPVVLYCDSPTCALSKEVAVKLAHEYGYRKVSYMPGGYQEWQRSLGR